jgi:hypothetical protein
MPLKKEGDDMADKISYKAQISCKSLNSFFGDKEEEE